MASYNKIILIGNLTRDPQLSYLPSQTPVVEFGLAVNRRWRDRDGQQRDDVCFIDCRAYSKQAETINQYITKGRQILVEGRLEFDQWETPEGQKRSKHRVMVTAFQFLDSGQGRSQGAAAPAAAARQAPPPPAGGGAPPPDDMGAPEGEDIPF
jgi:single-strand DNA-binding protein